MKVKAKTAVFLTLLLIAGIILPSCGGVQITQLNDRLIVEAIGIDLSDDGFEVSVQTLDTQASGTDSNAQTSESVTKSYLFRGETIGEALSEIGLQTGYIPLYSQMRVLVIGMEAAKGHISELLDFFLREYTARNDVPIAVAAEKAQDIISASFGKNVIGAQVIEDSIKAGDTTGNAVSVPMYKFVNLLISETDTAYCPVIGTTENDFSEDKNVSVNGTALFSDGALCAVIDTERTQGLLFLTDKLKKSGYDSKHRFGEIHAENNRKQNRNQNNSLRKRHIVCFQREIECGHHGIFKQRFQTAQRQ